MRVLYLHQYFNTPAMAGGTRSFEMARRLVDAGHTVHMVTTDRAADNGRAGGWRRSVEAGIDVHWLAVPYHNRMGNAARMRAFLQFATAAGRRAVQLGGDVVFATSTPLTIALPAVYATRRLGVPMVFEVRDLWPEMPIAVGALRGRIPIAAARGLERFAYRNARHVVALSPGMRDGVVAAGMAEADVTVIPNSCDSALFDVDPERGREFRAKFPWLGDRPLVLYGGTLGALNGVDYLARLAAEMRRMDPEVRFLVVGTGKEDERVRRTAAELGVLEQTFFMLGSLPKREMPDCLSAATVATSLFIDLEPMWVNSANKFFDALAARRPVMINYEGWQAALLRQTGAGLVVPPRDPRAAAESLGALLRSPERLAHARQAAGELAREEFDRDHLAQRLSGVLERAVGSRGR